MALAGSALLLTAAAPRTAVDAERAFAAKAQTEGQWTAFRATAAPDAIMFLPGPTSVREFLKDRKDPRVAYMWWPAQAYTSCDGEAAVTTGPAVQGAYRGYFTTVWRRQPDGGWKWLIDHGDALATPRPAGEKAAVRRASCGNRPGVRPLIVPPDGGAGSSADGTLLWGWQVLADGSRRVRAQLWNGRRYEEVINDQVGPSTP